ncbi:hypothetical protein ACFOGG_09960 [Brenneria rubrifaciens]|uniref:hypothetical protein n=1 Tax=Brenneria rubrifaciens TaxID=55213 RepID=UPI001586CCF8
MMRSDKGHHWPSHFARSIAPFKLITVYFNVVHCLLSAACEDFMTLFDFDFYQSIDNCVGRATGVTGKIRNPHHSTGK